jgi:Ras-related protein Rab-12
MGTRRNRRNINGPVPDVKLQLIIIGDSGVGKTSFMDRFIEGGNGADFKNSFNPTVGIDFKVKNVEINKKRIKLQIWDTAGQEKFNSITTAYYRSARGAIIMYDVTRPTSFKSIDKWFTLMQEHGRGDVEVALVGNKCDLRSDKKVDSKSGENLATELGCHFYESSAKDNLNIENVIMGVVHKILANMPLEAPPTDPNGGGDHVTDLNSGTNQNQSGCSC